MIIQRFSRAGPRGRAREWATLGVHPLSWLPNNNRLEEVCGTLIKGTFSSRLLLSNQDKGCTPSVAHSLPHPLPSGFCSTCQLHLCQDLVKCALTSLPTWKRSDCTISVAKTSEHQTAVNWLFYPRQAGDFKVAQFLSSNHTPNFPNLGAFQP